MEKFLVLGLGKSGLTALRWLSQQGITAYWADDLENPPLLSQLDPDLQRKRWQDGSFDFDALIKSPGVPRTHPLVRKAQDLHVPIYSDVELFVRTRREPILAITGSNGKTTVTTLVGEMLKKSGIKTVVAGNIGLPVLESLQNSAEIYVLELSSYQLEDTPSLAPWAATVLNISDDHLDRYPSRQAYIDAKANIYRNARFAIINRDDPCCRVMPAHGEHLTFGLGEPPTAKDAGIQMLDREPWLVVQGIPILKVAELGLKGAHHTANALAAILLALCANASLDAIRETLRSFSGLPHRFTHVGTVGGVDIIDDSKGTNVGATLAALAAVQQPVVLIAGGDGKGQDFSPLVTTVAPRARAVVLLGKDAKILFEALIPAQVPLFLVNSLKEAVRCAKSIAKPGDAILLSPACASTDMFRNYHERGELFCRYALES